MGNYNQGPSDPVFPRPYAEVSRFLDGLDPVGPGVVQVHRWGPPAGDPNHDREIPNYAAVGRKP